MSSRKIWNESKLLRDHKVKSVNVRYRKLFVGGIDSDVTENDLKAYFEKFGVITGCTIHRNRDTGKSRGFGFVTFKDPSSIDDVQNSRPHTICNCEVNSFTHILLQQKNSHKPSREV
ncbi:hypothetical protein CEXT_318551 [Caerostris extrusa]|uniref:RRM domain-containing protein n=1 Tax=Caerostris extrusa TaxID=172846 RepID=A0AAV4VYW3_CAEEX|nr:hypothetical protein CEXT_318551 [Caerostris extrusa]